MYRPAEHRWRQTWTDAGNSVVDFYGSVDDGKMVLTGTKAGPNGAELLVRMEFTRNEDGSVRQYGTRSADHGQTWQPRYDYTYRPARQGANPLLSEVRFHPSSGDSWERSRGRT